MIKPEDLLLENSQTGDVKAVELLILEHKDNIDVNHADDSGCTGLMYASAKGRTQCVELLLKHPKINVNHANKYKYTALMMAIMYVVLNVLNYYLNIQILISIMLVKLL